MTAGVAFHPRWVSAPGDTILNALGKRDWTVEDLADHLGLSDPQTRRIVVGESEIDDGIASRLSSVLGGSSEFWLTREKRYREGIRWLAVDEVSRNLPLEQMVAFGWIDSDSAEWQDRAEACIRFFNVSTSEEWNAKYGQVVNQARYRASSSFEADEAAVAVWLRRAEVEAECMALDQWDPQGLRSAVAKIRFISREPDPQTFIPKIQSLLAANGVALAVVRAPSGSPMSGAAFITESGRRTIALSARHLSDDHLWFSLMHEIGHVLLQDLREPVLDDFDAGSEDIAEVEANEFASRALNPAGLEQLIGPRAPTMRQVVAFASRQGIAAGIVVGQLQHAQVLRHNQLNQLRRRYKWDGITLKTARR